MVSQLQTHAPSLPPSLYFSLLLPHGGANENPVWADFRPPSPTEDKAAAEFDLLGRWTRFRHTRMWIGVEVCPAGQWADDGRGQHSPGLLGSINLKAW